MIHVGTAEDVVGSMADGWLLWGQRLTASRGYTYWLQPAAGPYAAKRVSLKIVTALEASGQITGAADCYGDLRYTLSSAEPLQGELVGA